MKMRSISGLCKAQQQPGKVLQAVPRRLALITTTVVPAVVCQARLPAKAAGDNTRQLSFLPKAQAATAERRDGVLSEMQGLGTEFDSNGVERLPYRAQGWDFWEYDGHKVHYVQAGDKGPPVVLVHGFGASAYHWRYNIPVLAASHRVYAVDLLGFGWSDKPLIPGYADYSVWQDQLAAFIREVVGGEPVIMVGNSLGGYNSLATAAKYPELVRGVVLLNGAGRFEDVKVAVERATESALPSGQEGTKRALREISGTDGASSSGASSVTPSLMGRLMEPVKAVMVRGTVYFSFLFAKQPARIEQVLLNVYPNSANVDKDLIASIAQPATHPYAAEVFYRIITGSGQSLNSLLDRIEAPLFLLWGESDPWITPRSALRIKSLYPNAELVLVPAGHCPHDEAPEEVNRELIRWIAAL